MTARQSRRGAAAAAGLAKKRQRQAELEEARRQADGITGLIVLAQVIPRAMIVFRKERLQRIHLFRRLR